MGDDRKPGDERKEDNSCDTGIESSRTLTDGQTGQTSVEKGDRSWQSPSATSRVSSVTVECFPAAPNRFGPFMSRKSHFTIYVVITKEQLWL